jgi:hypothetical protein
MSSIQLPEKRTILMYGRSNAGKTAQIGELAEYVYVKYGLKTRLATADKGGTRVIKPYIDLGIIEVEAIGDADPWMWTHKVVRGFRKVGGSWKLDKDANAQIGLFAFESLRGIAETLMQDLAHRGAAGVNIGGGSNVSFVIAADGEQLKVGGNNQAQFGIVQGRVTDEVWQSQKLSAPFIVWTSSTSKDDDQNAGGKVIGPDVIGKALTTEVPRWFDITARLDVLPAQQGKEERHLLFLGTHADVNAGNAAGLGNIRKPLDSPKLDTTVIEPASIVKALEVLDKGADQAVEVIRKRMEGAKR